MKPARHIALWLAAAIVTIAALLMASGAQAHEGHAHPVPHAGFHAGRTAPAADIARPVPRHATLDERRVTAGVQPAAIADVSVIGAARHACTCPACAAGGPCDHVAASCCATALPPSALPGFPPLARGARAPAGDGPLLAGIVPEAQTEPPRPLA